MQLSAGKYYVWYGDTKYHAIHAKKRGRIALVSGEKAMKEIIASVNGFDAMKQQRDELLAVLKEIAAIKDKMVGGDWDEIDEARNIAKAAIYKCES